MKRFINRTAVVCMLLVAFLFVTGCSNLSLFSRTLKIDSQDALYDAIIECMQKNQSAMTFEYTGTDADTAVDIETILNTIPGLKSIEYTITSNVAGDKYKFNMSYWDSDAIIYAYKNSNSSYLTSRQKTMYDKYISIINVCTSTANTAFENERAIYNYLVDNITYDRKITSHFNAYEALTEGRAVCAGYSECFRTLMEMLGYECTVISGTADNENHMWNAICLNNEWYQVDVTWGDTDEQNTNPVRIYAYFNINEKEMSMDHTRVSALPDNYVEGTRYTYVNYAGVPTIYNQQDLNRYIASSMSAKDGTIEFITRTELSVKSSASLANVNCSYTLSTIEKDNMYYHFMNCIYY